MILAYRQVPAVDVAVTLAGMAEGPGYDAGGEACSPAFWMRSALEDMVATVASCLCSRILFV